MALPQMPTEVLLHILKYQSTNVGLCSMALTCKALRDEAQQTLFHTPVPRTAYLHLIFLDSLLSSPERLGPMVREFIHVSGSAYRDGEDKVLVEKTGKVLQAMCNPKRLAFRNAKSLPASVLDGTTFQLDAFDWGSTHDYQHILGEFLPTQPGLKHLTFRGRIAHATPDSVKLLCPGLRSLAGGRAAVKLFLPGRCVTHLQWTPEDPDEALSSAAGLGDELERVYFLRCRVNHKDLERLSGKLRSLVLLEITGGGLVLNSGLKELQIGLEGIPTLQVLILVEYTAANPIPDDPLHLGRVSRDIFARCPYLEHIDISVSSSSVLCQFRRFHRASILEGTSNAGTVIDDATVYTWSLSNFQGVSNRIQYVARQVRAVSTWSSVTTFS